MMLVILPDRGFPACISRIMFAHSAIIASWLCGCWPIMPGIGACDGSIG